MPFFCSARLAHLFIYFAVIQKLSVVAAVQQPVAFLRSQETKFQNVPGAVIEKCHVSIRNRRGRKQHSFFTPPTMSPALYLLYSLQSASHEYLLGEATFNALQ